jgi:hypothetical protein
MEIFIEILRLINNYHDFLSEFVKLIFTVFVAFSGIYIQNSLTIVKERKFNQRITAERLITLFTQIKLGFDIISNLKSELAIEKARWLSTPVPSNFTNRFLQVLSQRLPSSHYDKIGGLPDSSIYFLLNQSKKIKSKSNFMGFPFSEPFYVINVRGHLNNYFTHIIENFNASSTSLPKFPALLNIEVFENNNEQFFEGTCKLLSLIDDILLEIDSTWSDSTLRPLID